MKGLLICSLLFLGPACNGQHFSSDFENQPKEAQSSFELSYTLIGMGSNMGSKTPEIYIKGNNLLYISQIHWTYEGYDKSVDTIYHGTFPDDDINAILKLVRDIDDTLIYNWSSGVMSGSLIYLTVKDSSTNVTFKLHNAGNYIAEQIVTIVKRNVSRQARDIYISHFPGDYRRDNYPRFKDPVTVIKRIFDSYKEYDESTDSPYNLDSMRLALFQLGDPLADGPSDDTFRLLFDVWNYYMITDFPIRDYVEDVLYTHKEVARKALAERLATPYEWESENTFREFEILQEKLK